MRTAHGARTKQGADWGHGPEALLYRLAHAASCGHPVHAQLAPCGCAAGEFALLVKSLVRCKARKAWPGETEPRLLPCQHDGLAAASMPTSGSGLGAAC